jgi:hypothetical protein
MPPPHAYYFTALSFTLLFSAAWFLAPYAAVVVARQYSGVRRMGTHSRHGPPTTNTTLLRLKARKQLLLSNHRYHAPIAPMPPDESGVARWLLRLRQSLMTA